MWSARAYLSKDMGKQGGKGPREHREAAFGAEEVVPGQDSKFSLPIRGCEGKGRVS